jgi:hypothetical protein
MTGFSPLSRDQWCEGNYGIYVRSLQQSRIHAVIALPFNRSDVMRRLVNSSALRAIALSLVACSESVVPPAIPLDALRSATTPFNNAGQCLVNDIMTWPEFVLGGSSVEDPSDVNCTSNDLGIAAITATEIFKDGAWVPVEAGASCTAGEPVTFRFSASLINNAQDRLDAGVWLATDGGGALGGSCNHYNVPTNPLPGGTSNLEGDQCGDFRQGDLTTVDFGEITVPCVAGGDGNLAVGSCLAWSSIGNERFCPVSTVSGPDGFRAGTLPENTAKCNCQTQSVNITPSAPRTALLEVRKACSPATDGGTFDLSIDGVVVADNAACGSGTGAQSVSAGSTASPGAFHNFAEGDFNTAAYSSTYQCVQRTTGALVSQCGAGGTAACSGTGTGPVSIRTDPDQDVVCSFTNTVVNTSTDGSIAFLNGTFSLLRDQTADALSGTVPIRNNSMGPTVVTVTSLTITDAWVKQGNMQIPRTVTGCVFTPASASINPGATQNFTMTGCDVSPSVDNKKDLNFVVRATTTGTAQPFYERTYKAKAQ